MNVPIYHQKPLFCTLCHIYHQVGVIIWSLEAEESVGEGNKGRCSSINSDLLSHHCIGSFQASISYSSNKQRTSQLLKSEHTYIYPAYSSFINMSFISLCWSKSTHAVYWWVQLLNMYKTFAIREKYVITTHTLFPKQWTCQLFSQMLEIV